MINESVSLILFKNNEFNINMKDDHNIMRKIEQLYNGEQVSFSPTDILILKKIISITSFKCFPDCITNYELKSNFNDIIKCKLFIDKNLFLKFLQTVIPK